MKKKKNQETFEKKLKEKFYNFFFFFFFLPEIEKKVNIFHKRLLLKEILNDYTYIRILNNHQIDINKTTP